MGNQVKHGLGGEPAGDVLAERLKGLDGLVVADLLEGGARVGAGGHGDELGVAEALEGDEPVDSGLDGGGGGQQAVVAEDGGLFAADGLGDGVALLAAEDDAVELVVERNVVVKGAGVLGDEGEGQAEAGKGPGVEGVGVGGADDVGALTVDYSRLETCPGEMPIGLGRLSLLRLPAAWMRKADWFTSLTAPWSRTLPVSSRRTRSERLMRGQETPRGFTQKVLGSTGSCTNPCALVATHNGIPRPNVDLPGG